MRFAGILFLIGGLLGGPAAVTSAADHAVVLQYHHVAEGTPGTTSVTPERFAEHLARLHADGFRVASLRGVIELLGSGREVPDSTVCLTADDGYANLRENALPLLRRYGWTMTVFVCPEQVDRGRPLHLDWNDLRALQAAGWTIAPHGSTHEHLTVRRPDETAAAWRRRVTRNIAGSLERLRSELDDIPPLFAYPYGEYDPELMRIVRELGLVGFGQHSGPVGPLSDAAALPRFPVSGAYAGTDDVAMKAATLPLPVVSVEPLSPLVPAGVERPVLRLELAAGGWNTDRLAAFATQQGRIELEWLDRDAGIVQVRAGEPLPAGRSRYNLTAPGRDGRRWYWFSHPWLRSGASGAE